MDQAVKDELFQLKADLVPLTVIKLTQPSSKVLYQQIADKISKAPKYFDHAPVLIDVVDLAEQETLDLSELTQNLKQQKLIPVAIRGLKNTEQAEQHDLAILTSTLNKEKQPSKVNTPPPPKNQSPTKIITKPIRAGSQVYARGGDLIVLASVNSGAECFADGSIHVYGSLRGRALAGVSGDKNARIFCKSLEAELIAIAGHYLVNEKIKPPSTVDSMIQAYLSDNKIQINSI